RVADEPDVRQALVVVRPRDGEPARRVVGRDRSRLIRHAGLPGKSGRIRPLKCNVRACRYDGRFDGHMAVTRSSREPRSDAARNHEALVRATIAADAGVGIGTLYRHFPSRDDLLDYLTHVSFQQVLANAQAAQHGATTA